MRFRSLARVLLVEVAAVVALGLGLLGLMRLPDLLRDDPGLLLRDASRLKGAIAELRSEYGGSVPLGPGDGVPLISGDRRARGLRMLIQNPEGRRAITEALLGEVPEKERACPLHGELLALGLVPMLYGRYEADREYSRAASEAFPRAARNCLGGCVVGEAEDALVLCCRSCDLAREAWRRGR